MLNPKFAYHYVSVVEARVHKGIQAYRAVLEPSTARNIADIISVRPSAATHMSKAATRIILICKKLPSGVIVAKYIYQKVEQCEDK
jgi:hypothetical protein